MSSMHKRHAVLFALLILLAFAALIETAPAVKAEPSRIPADAAPFYCLPRTVETGVAIPTCHTGSGTLIHSAGKSIENGYYMFVTDVHFTPEGTASDVNFYQVGLHSEGLVFNPQIRTAVVSPGTKVVSLNSALVFRGGQQMAIRASSSSFNHTVYIFGYYGPSLSTPTSLSTVVASAKGTVPNLSLLILLTSAVLLLYSLRITGAERRPGD